MSYFEWQGNDLILRIKVQPRSSREGFSRVLGNQIRLGVNAPPIDGKANAQIIRYLAKLFRVAKGQVTILSGETGRDKRICITRPRFIPEDFTPQARP